MIPYDDLLRALADWRARQGLPPLHALDYLGALKQPRIDTSRAIAAITGSLQLLDIDTAGAEYDYDEPLVPPPMAQPVSSGWYDYEGNAAQVGKADEDSGAGYPGYDYEEPQPEYAAQSDYDHESPQSDYESPQSGYDYGHGQAAYDVHSVGDSTAIYHDLGSTSSAQAYQPVPANPGIAATPSYGFVDEDEDESTMIGGMPARSAAPAPAVSPPPSSDSTAIFDTSLATNAAARVDAEYGQRGGGVPSEPVYDSIAAAAEYQAERVAEENAYDDADDHTYVPAFYGSQAPAASGYPPGEPDHRPTQVHSAALTPASEPPPLEPPPGLSGDDAFEIRFDDD